VRVGTPDGAQLTFYAPHANEEQKGAEMATNNPQRSVLLIGKSQLVLGDAVSEWARPFSRRRRQER
jgi:hypothetical protein